LKPERCGWTSRNVFLLSSENPLPESVRKSLDSVIRVAKAFNLSLLKSAWNNTSKQIFSLLFCRKTDKGYWF